MRSLKNASNKIKGEKSRLTFMDVKLNTKCGSGRPTHKMEPASFQYFLFKRSSKPPLGQMRLSPANPLSRVYWGNQTPRPPGQSPRPRPARRRRLDLLQRDYAAAAGALPRRPRHPARATSRPETRVSPGNMALKAPSYLNLLLNT